MVSKVEYFTSGEAVLSVECYLPEKPSGKGHVFYYGGGWIDDNRHRFHRYASDLAERGITVFLPQYRVYGLHQTLPAQGMKDVMAGLRFVESLYPAYGIRKEEVSWGGGSAGAQLVLTAALISPFREGIAVLPEKMILFNPVCCPHSLEKWVETQIGRSFDFSGLCPLCDQDTAPIHRPSLLAMHGTEDEIAPIADLEAFEERYSRAGGRCRILSYPKRGHGFHHPENSEADYRNTLKEILKFIEGDECL